MKSGVYIIENIVNGRRYVGSSQNVEKRLRDHLQRLKAKTHANFHLQAAFIKYGEAAFSKRILEKTEDCIGREQHYIDTLNPEYNILKIAGRSVGYRHSEESKAKFGRPKSVEDKLRLSLALSGKKHPNFGKPRSEDTRKKIGESNSRRVERISPFGEIVLYSSLTSAEKDGFHGSGIRLCCIGKQEKHKGYHWRYATNGECHE